MPVSDLGQLITFAIEVDGDQKFASFIYVHATKALDTVQKIASKRGHPEQARAIADLNGIRSVRTKLKAGRRLKVPGTLRQAASFHVLADGPPSISAGYAKFDITDRPERVGLPQFTGYDPVEMRVPVRFESFIENDGVGIERDIALLERMAGRGNFAGAATGPPPIIRISATDATGQTIPLIPTSYQWRPQNPSAPLWQVADIEWSDDETLRNDHGNRVRAPAVVVLKQYVKLSVLERSASHRSKAKRKRKK